MNHPYRLLTLAALLLVIIGISGVRSTAAATDHMIFLPLTMRDGITSPSTTPTTAPTTPTTDLAALRAETVRLINIERVNAGCPAAVENDTLDGAAQAWSDYMEQHPGVFDHSYAVDTMWYVHHGYAPGAAENIAQGQRSPAEVVAAWMDDEPHKRIVLFCAHAAQGATYDLGVGVDIVPNGAGIWTMALGERLP